MSDPKHPLDDIWFLDGYLDHTYSNDEAPDGAWFQMCVDSIEMKWPKANGHDVFMSYLEWKEKEVEAP